MEREQRKAQGLAEMESTVDAPTAAAMGMIVSQASMCHSQQTRPDGFDTALVRRFAIKKIG